MMRWVLAIAALAAAMPLAARAQEQIQRYKQVAAAASFDWLAGDWREDKAGRWTIEHWEAKPDGSMAGSGSSGHDSIVKESEAMTITRDGAVAVFMALPRDAQAPTPFREVAHGAQDVTFENAGHDYPQRIRYWREGDALLAEISLKDGTQPMRWRYTRIR